MRVILLLKFNEYPKIQRKLKNPTFTIKKKSAIEDKSFQDGN